MALIHAQTEDSYEHLCLGEYLCSSVFFLMKAVLGSPVCDLFLDSNQP